MNDIIREALLIAGQVGFDISDVRTVLPVLQFCRILPMRILTSI